MNLWRIPGAPLRKDEPEEIVAKLRQVDLLLWQGRRALAERVMIERGLDPADTALRNSVVFKMAQAPR